MATSITWMREVVVHGIEEKGRDIMDEGNKLSKGDGRRKINSNYRRDERVKNSNKRRDGHRGRRITKEKSCGSKVEMGNRRKGKRKLLKWE